MLRQIKEKLFGKNKCIEVESKPKKVTNKSRGKGSWIRG